MPMYLRCSTLIERQVSGNNLFLAVVVTVLVLMFQIFTHILIAKYLIYFYRLKSFIV
jgi:hypothetical protein